VSVDPPPVIRTEPPPQLVQVTASVSKWVGIAGLWILAAWLFSRDQPDAGSVVLMFALTQSGMAVQASTGVALAVRTALNTEQVKEDVSNIRDNPNMPGTPTEHRDG
jgi:hypothetical protein